MIRVKICGITREADREAAVQAGADAIGVTSAVPVETPREVDPDRAAALLDAVPPFLATALVTMPEDADAAVDLVRTVGPDVLQVHGPFPADDLGSIRERTGVRVLRAVDATDTETARAAAGVADGLLVDAASETGRGGTGRTADWARAHDLRERLDVPVVLAGGLTPDNVDEAVRTVDPYGVDVASGVERTGGVKDHDAVRDFVATARGAMEAVPP